MEKRMKAASPQRAIPNSFIIAEKNIPRKRLFAILKFNLFHKIKIPKQNKK